MGCGVRSNDGRARFGPGAEGFLGSTSGATEDGRLFVMARFDSEESARRNSDRPEQAAWWAETEKVLDDVSFQDSVDVVVMRGGGSNDAGFVQIMRGHVIDASKMADLRDRMMEFENVMAQHRPDVIGDITAMHADGTYTDTIYFTSEVDARSAEAQDGPAEMQACLRSGRAPPSSTSSSTSSSPDWSDADGPPGASTSRRRRAPWPRTMRAPPSRRGLGRGDALSPPSRGSGRAQAQEGGGWGAGLAAVRAPAARVRDHAPWILLVEESGGRITDRTGGR